MDLGQHRGRIARDGIVSLAELEWRQQNGRDTLAASVAHRAQPSTAAGAG